MLILVCNKKKTPLFVNINLELKSTKRNYNNFKTNSKSLKANLLMFELQSSLNSLLQHLLKTEEKRHRTKDISPESRITCTSIIGTMDVFHVFFSTCSCTFIPYHGSSWIRY